MATLRSDTTRDAVWRVSFDNPPENRVTPEMIVELQAIVTKARAGSGGAGRDLRQRKRRRLRRAV